MVLEPMRIAKRYVRGYFIVDACATFPFDLFFVGAENGQVSPSPTIHFHFRSVPFLTSFESGALSGDETRKEKCKQDKNVLHYNTDGWYRKYEICYAIGAKDGAPPEAVPPAPPLSAAHAYDASVAVRHSGAAPSDVRLLAYWPLARLPLLRHRHSRARKFDRLCFASCCNQFFIRNLL